MPATSNTPARGVAAIEGSPCLLGKERSVLTRRFWAREVGFYGGIDYSYGYFGEGYQGGRWDNGVFFYNRSVNNVVGLGGRGDRIGTSFAALHE
jgi:hypothetical protein